MQRELAKDIPQGVQREEFLRNNCDRIEEKGYMKHYTPDELQQMKEQLSEHAIIINDIEEDKKAKVDDYNEMLKPLKEQMKKTLIGLKQKAEHVVEPCYKFVDTDTRQVGYYNNDGDLIESRPAYADELQSTIFSISRKTGTHDES